MSLTNKENTHPTIVHISSERRISGTISDFESEYIDFKLNNYDTVCLLQASIPRTFYNISESNNKFFINEGSGNILIQLEEGSYTVQNIINALTTALNTNGTNEYSITYKTSQEPQDFKFTFNLITNNNGTTQPQFIFVNELYSVLGFNKNTTYTFTSNTLKSINCINLSRINSAFITSNMINDTSDEILQEILAYGSFQMLSIAYFYNNNLETASKEMKRTQGKASFRFTLIDEEGKKINTNGINYTFSLIFYNRNKTHELHQNEIKLNNIIRQFEIKKKQEEIIKESTPTQIPQPSNVQPSNVQPSEPIPEIYQNYQPQYNLSRLYDATKIKEEYI